MSLGVTPAAASAGERIAAIQGMVSALAGAPTSSPAPAASGGAFAQALATAQTPASATAPTGGGGAFGPEITTAATRNGIDPALLTALVKQESGFNPNARSAAGAVGLTQLMPATAAGLGVSDPTDPAQSLEGGAKYLRQQLDRFGGDTAKALAAYNAGPGAVQKYGGVPPYPETQAYVRRILADVSGRVG